MTKKAVILAAGEGKRLRPFTETMPKVMLPVANKPLLEYVFDAVKKSGIEEIIVVVGYKKEVIMEHIRQHNLPLSTYVGHGEPRWAEEGILEWDFGGNSFHLGLLEANSNKKKLEKLFQDFFKKKIQLRFVGQASQAPKKKREAAAAAGQQRKKSIKETLEHPRIKDVIDIFQAEVADVKTPKENP